LWGRTIISGFNQEGDYRKLWQWRSIYGFDAEEIPLQEVQNETVSSTRIRQALSEGYIQRANAYLDHFYIIIGAAVKDDPAFSPDIPFIKIPVTEKTKLVPPHGLYAVSCAADTFFSRGMVFIPDNNGDVPDIYVHLENYEDDIPGKRMTLFFHKRLAAYKPGEPVQSSIAKGIEEMQELIF